jgi:phage terminase large subunit-like protein
MPPPTTNPLLARAIAEALETSWRLKARPDQIDPPGDHSVFLLLGGRGAGKTRALSEWVLEQHARGCRHIALLAPTAADTRNVLVEGPSGILACAPPYDRPVFNPSLRRLTWRDGAIATLYSADEPERLRGPQHDAAAVDELCAFRRPEAWDQLLFGLRLGNRPRVAIATTPKPTRLLKSLLAREGQDVVVSRASSYLNRANLAPEFFAHIIKRFEGTRLGRQELNAEVLDDVVGALWSMSRIDDLRRDTCPQFRRVVVAIDPSGGEGDEHDECGIVAAGIDEADHGWLLVDASGNFSPHDWAQAGIRVYHTLHADRIVAEVNYGGAMVESVLRSVDPNIPFRAVTASRGKVARAEPIAALYEQSRVHHLGSFPELEDELCGFTSAGYAGGSPNRADALVWALTDLMATPMKGEGLFHFYRCMSQGIPIGRPAAAPVAPDNRVDWRKRYDERNERPTPDHPDVAPTVFEPVNGPMARMQYAKGSLENP